MLSRILLYLLLEYNELVCIVILATSRFRPRNKNRLRLAPLV